MYGWRWRGLNAQLDRAYIRFETERQLTKAEAKSIRAKAKADVDTLTAKRNADPEYQKVTSDLKELELQIEALQRKREAMVTRAFQALVQVKDKDRGVVLDLQDRPYVRRYRKDPTRALKEAVERSGVAATKSTMHGVAEHAVYIILNQDSDWTRLRVEEEELCDRKNRLNEELLTLSVPRDEAERVYWTMGSYLVCWNRPDENHPVFQTLLQNLAEDEELKAAVLKAAKGMGF